MTRLRPTGILPHETISMWEAGRVDRETTRDEFERSYAQRGELTVDFLRGMGLRAVPCDCREDGCRGWQMRNLASLLVPGVRFAVEHIPDDWDGQDLLDELIAEGETKLVHALRRALEENRELT